jgi:hypothetical protein
MNTKNYLIGLTAGVLATLSGCATVPGNTARAVGNAVLSPAKAVVYTIEERGNLAQGVRQSAVDVVESVARIPSGEKSARPDEMGEANRYINERPVLSATANIGTAIGMGAGIAELLKANPTHIEQAMIYMGVGQALREGIEYAVKD